MNANQIITSVCLTVFGIVCIQSCTELSKSAIEKFNPTKPKSPLDGIFLIPNSHTPTKEEQALKDNPLI